MSTSPINGTLPTFTPHLPTAVAQPAPLVVIPQHTNRLISLKNRIITILCVIKDYILGIITYLFQSHLSEFKLHQAEQLNANHINIYAQDFNQADRGAVILNAGFSMIEANAGRYIEADGIVRDSWLIPTRPGTGNFFENLIANFKYENPTLVANAARVRGSNNLSLREILEANNKKVASLNISVNNHSLGGMVEGRHWTCIHLNFENNTISYFDSVKPNLQAEKVVERLHQTLEWLQTTDSAGNLWRIERPLDDLANPSVIRENKQWDGFNCGIFIIHFTALAGQGRTHEEINAIPFPDMHRQIEAQRQEVMNCVNPKLEARRIEMMM